MAFLTEKQLAKVNFRKRGKNVKISDKASLYGVENIEIGDYTRIDDFSIISAGEAGIAIGNNVHIACYVSLIGKARIVINDFAGISSRTAIYSSNDDYSGDFLTGPTIPPKFTNVMHNEVIIGKHAVIGAFTMILPGVNIGDGAAVGAFSLVKKSVDAYTIVAGIPSKKISQRNIRLLELERKYLSEK